MQNPIQAQSQYEPIYGCINFGALERWSNRYKTKNDDINWKRTVLIGINSKFF